MGFRDSGKLVRENPSPLYYFYSGLFFPKALKRLLDSRQLGLKLIANVMYGYTAASFSGRMPCVEVGGGVFETSTLQLVCIAGFAAVLISSKGNVGLSPDKLATFSLSPLLGRVSEWISVLFEGTKRRMKTLFSFASHRGMAAPSRPGYIIVPRLLRLARFNSRS